jgi:uncharacterized damage-inducible protein DinB
MTQPEPWLSGSHTDLPAVVRAAVHALELSRSDIEKWCAPLNDAAFNARPSGIAPVAFHLRHIVRSLDRLLTYAQSEQLNDEQLSALKSEPDPNAVQTEVMEEFRKGVDAALGRLRTFVNADLEAPRSVGRKALPTTVGGLLVHCADHAQRHTGQAVTTAKLVSKI